MTEPNPTPAVLRERDREVLCVLEAANRSLASLRGGRAWATPLDCGGSNGSDHSYRLAKLCRVGLAERKQRNLGEKSIGRGPRACGMYRGSWEYRVTKGGAALLSAKLALAQEAEYVAG